MGESFARKSLDAGLFVVMVGLIVSAIGHSHGWW